MSSEDGQNNPPWNLGKKLVIKVYILAVLMNWLAKVNTSCFC